MYGQTRGQRCWGHKSANVLDKLPKDPRRRPNNASRRSGWCPTASGWRWPLTCSLPLMKQNIPRRPSAWPKITRSYWRFMISPSRTGAIFGRLIRSNRRLPPCAHGPTKLADAAPMSRCWRWYSNSIRVPRSGGIGYEPRITCHRS